MNIIYPFPTDLEKLLRGKINIYILYIYIFIYIFHINKLLETNVFTKEIKHLF